MDKKGWKIDSMILEKRLTLDCSKMTDKEATRATLCEEASFNLQPTSEGKIASEHAWLNQEVIKMLAKIIPRFEHGARSGYGMNAMFCGGVLKLLCRTRKLFFSQT